MSKNYPSGQAGDRCVLPRRVVLKAAGAAVLSAWLLPMAGCRSSSPVGTVDLDLYGPDRPTPRGKFLTDSERVTLRALVDRLIPGGLKPGAVDAECDEAIDAFLAAFQTDPPLIYAGGPFSDRGGAARNDFVRFIPLDEYEELAWRIVIEGSQGIPAREVNGPVKGLQQIFREGLAHLESRAQLLATGILPGALGGPLLALLGNTPLAVILELVDTLTGVETFADLPSLLRDLIVLDPTDAKVQELVDVAFPATLNAMYGAPEYGGNKDLVGWSSNNFDGDTHPRGYTDAQVIYSDNPGPFDGSLPESYGGNPEPRTASRTASDRASLGPLPIGLAWPLLVGDPEATLGTVADAQGSLARLRASLAPQLNSSAVLRWEANNG